MMDIPNCVDNVTASGYDAGTQYNHSLGGIT
jgi:hypothetical protein